MSYLYDEMTKDESRRKDRNIGTNIMEKKINKKFDLENIFVVVIGQSSH